MRDSPGFPKKTETFLFFEIGDNAVSNFKSSLAKLLPQITTAQNTVDDRHEIKQHKRHHRTLLAKCGTNIAFTTRGLQKVKMCLSPLHLTGLTRIHSLACLMILAMQSLLQAC